MSNNQKKSVLVRLWCIRTLLFIFDAFIVNFSYFIAVIIRFSDSDSYSSQGIHYMQMLRSFAPWYTCACLILFLLLRQYNAVWRYAGFNDVKKLIVTNIFTCILYVCGSLMIVGRMPITVYVVGAGIQFVLMGIPRLTLRYFIETLRRLIENGHNDAYFPLMIIGICDNTSIIQKKMEKDRSSIVKPVCVVDYNYGYTGNSFNGLPVYCGPNAVSECIEKYNIRSVIFADNSQPKEYRESIRELCEAKDIEIRDFVIGTDSLSLSKGTNLLEILAVTDSSVCILQDGGEAHRFEDGKAAMKHYRGDCVVEKISIENGELCIRIGG